MEQGDMVAQAADVGEMLAVERDDGDVEHPCHCMQGRFEIGDAGIGLEPFDLREDATCMSPPSKDESRIGREGPSPIHPSTGIGEAWHGHLNDGVGSESRAKQSQRIPVSEESDLMAPVDQFLTESQCTSGVPTPLPCERICEPHVPSPSGARWCSMWLTIRSGPRALGPIDGCHERTCRELIEGGLDPRRCHVTHTDMFGPRACGLGQFSIHGLLDLTGFRYEDGRNAKMSDLADELGARGADDQVRGHEVMEEALLGDRPMHGTFRQVLGDPSVESDLQAPGACDLEEGGQDPPRRVPQVRDDVRSRWGPCPSRMLVRSTGPTR